jgi:hypothetical protein
MKKFFSKKFLAIIIFIALITSVPIIILADTERPSYDSLPLDTNQQVLSKIGSSTIVNRSDKKFFVPNNTSDEYRKWADNSPNYVSVSICGDNICSEGETTTCPDDCPSPKDYCGDGICKTVAGAYVRVPYDPPRIVTQYERICTYGINGWMYVPVVNFFVFYSGNAFTVDCDSVAKNLL